MMLEQQGYFERAARSTSKNGKDRINSAALRVSQGGARRHPCGTGDLSSRMQRCDSEKDSGYSEAVSDSVQSDGDDQRSSVSEPHRESSKGSTHSSSTAAGRNMAACEELTPIYVFKNPEVKQFTPEQLLHGPMAWSEGWLSLASGKAPTQLLLIQQPAMLAPSSSIAPPPSFPAPPQEVKKGGSRCNKNHSGKNSYLPILNSYPRIAPHPRKELHEGKGSMWVEGVKERGSEGQSRRKRVCTEEKREAVSTSRGSRGYSLHKSRGGHGFSAHLTGHASSSTHVTGHASSSTHLTGHASSTHLPSPHSSGSDSVGSPSISSSQKLPPPSSSDSPSSSSPLSFSPSSSTVHSPYRRAPDRSFARQRRFFNTAEILNQSGLMAITLRTKELLKQNAATEREIAQLRQHTHHLCHAAQSRLNGCSDQSDGLDRLLQAMRESGSYPDLDLHHPKVLSSSHQQSRTGREEDKETDNNMRTTETLGNPEVLFLHNIHDGTSPPSPLFAPSPGGEEVEHADSPREPMSTFLSVSFPRSVSEQGQRHTAVDKDFCDLTVFPESSTHSTFLL
ncbi:CLOCK-interacting pacemaker-like isoform X1 [Embiotoca jacksoni]|uniref:CLOCK-interacting pacemaker-like isoform X1 n=2 Tax=Embiotoca jacksoni TaxID=100190 RepID=UPI003703F81F